MRKYSRARRVAIAVACVMGSASPSWSAGVCIARLKDAGDEPVERLSRIDQGRWIVETKYGLYQFAESGGGLSRYEGFNPSRISHIVPLGRDLSLILSSRNTSAGRVFRVQNDALKVQEVNGSESLRFTAVGRLQMGAIIGTDRGLYRVDSSGTQFQEAAGADTGRVSLLEQSDENGWLVAAALGLFRYDNRNGRTERVPGADTGEVTLLERLAEGGWLAGAEKGLFRIDSAGRSLTPLASKKPFRVAEIQKLADGAWLVRGEQGLFVADPQGRRLDALDEDSASAWRIQHSDERGALLQNKRMTYVLPVGAKKIEFTTGEPLIDVQGAYAAQDGWIIAAQRGLFRADLQKRRITPLRGPALGRTTFLHPLKTGAFLIGSENGLFRTDTGLQTWEPVPGGGLGQVSLLAPVGETGFLIGGQKGLFRADANAQSAAPVRGANLTGVSAVERLPGGDWLVQTQGGLASVDQAGRLATLLPGGGIAQSGSVLQPLADGRMLIGSQHGLLTTVSAGDAAVAFQTSQTGDSWPGGATLLGTVSHSCSDFVDEMNLMIRASSSGSDSTARLLPTRVVAHAPGQATIAAEAATLRSGTWNLQLVSLVGGMETALGKPQTVSLETSIGQRIGANAPWLIAGLAGLQLLLVAALLGLARWQPASRLVLRSRLGKVFLWPSIILSRPFRMQRWILSSWFRWERDKVSAMPPTVPALARGPGDADAPLSELLDRLGSMRRIWVQGGSGMGKSAAFLTWRRAFFVEQKSLSRASRKYGFALVPVGAPMSGTRAATGGPEAVIVGFAAQSLAEGGVSINNASLRKMLRRGQMALAFDSPSGPVQDAIAAYVHANQDARILVTSELASRPGFEAWQLPRLVERARVEQLLQLWLGAYSGSQLATQLSRDDVLPQLSTYYDVRLAAEIVTDDPLRPVPADRISLYRAPFARAAAEGFEQQSLKTLSFLAWTMTLEGRFVLSEAETASLDEKSRALLTAERTRILRSIEGTYAFDHDQLRFFLAAEHLVASNERVSSLIASLEGSHIWSCGRQEQEELWRFVAAMLSSEDVTALWRFSLQQAEHAFLQCALHKRGLETNVFPIGFGTALSGRDETEAAFRLRSVEA